MKKQFKDYGKDVEDVEELTGTDIKINPDYYIHKALENAQNCLIDNDIKTGVYKFRMLVEHIEVLAEAAKMIPENYEEELKAYKEELKEEKDELIKNFNIANKKLGLLTKGVFQNKTISNPMII